MNAISAIVFDVDGTLINDDKEILIETIDVVRVLSEKRGVDFILASARSPQSLAIVAQRLGVQCGFVCFNGALSFYSFDISEQKYQTFKTLPLASCLTLVEELLKCDVTISAFTAKEWVASRSDYWLEREVRGTFLKPDRIGEQEVWDLVTNDSVHKIMCRGSEKGIAAALKRIDSGNLIGTRFFSDRSTAIEISPSDCTKLDALTALLAYHDHPVGNVVVFGDADNDLEMIEHFPNSVAMGNGSRRLKHEASFVIGSNNEPAIAEFLRQHVLSWER